MAAQAQEERVWIRLYEDGIERKQQQSRPHPIPDEFTFQPEIGEYAAEMYFEDEVYKRLYDERTKREEAMKYKIQEENERHPFMPSGAEEYNEECWHRLYAEGMEKLKKDKVRHEKAKSGCEFSFKPSITQFFTDEGPRDDEEVFQRLYHEAREKREDEVRRQQEADEVFKQTYTFRPQISPAIEGKGEGIYQELYQDAIGRKQHKLQKEHQQDQKQKKMFRPEIIDIGVAAKYKEPPKPLPMDDWKKGLFIPRLNNTKGVAPKYLEPRRRYEPIEPPPLRPGEKPAWVSPREATFMAQRESAKRSRSANTLYRGLDLFEDEYEGAGGRRRTEPNSTSKRGDGARLRRARSADPGPRHYSPVRSPVLRVDDPFKSRSVSSAGSRRTCPDRTPPRSTQSRIRRAQSADRSPRYCSPTLSSSLRSPPMDAHYQHKYRAVPTDAPWPVPDLWASDRGRQPRSTVRNADRLGLGSRFKFSLVNGSRGGLQSPPAAFRTDGLTRIGGGTELSSVPYRYPPIGRSRGGTYVSPRRYYDSDTGTPRTLGADSVASPTSRSSSTGRTVPREGRVIDLTQL
uniref:Uncharacterized protein n=1 Tax=Eutreptiella gymnastica TaxID=73025 RepID=A0A7S4G187_9EUGL|mmetsp:Transcript_62720/g.103462  ORF Transcript_62720/g.103462 Transcript_62720/m.103462 type:complete len:572 (+) Transcript_62720:40-1755(+)